MIRAFRLVYFANLVLPEQAMQDISGYLYAPSNSLAAASYRILLRLDDGLQVGIRGVV